MSSFLFTLWAGGGNVPPQLALARRLTARGHQVRVLAPAILRQKVVAAGATYEPYDQTPEHDEAVPERSLLRDFDARTPLGALTAARNRLLVGLAAPVAADAGAILEREAVDVVAPDWMLLGALYAAERAGVPAAPLVHSVPSLPVEGMPAFGFGWMPATGPLGRVRDAIGRQGFERMLAGPLLQPLNEVRRRLGLRPLDWAFAPLFAAARMLVLTSAAFDYPADFPANVQYVGPQLEDAEWHAEWAPPWSEDDTRPLVVVGLSTTYQAHERLLHDVVRAVGRLPVRALVTTGAGVAAPAGPGNVHVEPFVPHARVLPHADAVVTHAGHGTTVAALAHGVPLVCLPISRDQPDIAARVAWHRAGVRLRGPRTPRRIAAAIARVLGDDAYRRSAGRLAAAIAHEAPERRGVEALEQIATAAPAQRQA